MIVNLLPEITKLGLRQRAEEVGVVAEGVDGVLGL